MAKPQPNFPPEIKRAIARLNARRLALAYGLVAILVLIAACIVLVFTVEDAFQVVVPLGVLLIPGLILVYRLRSGNHIARGKKELIAPLIRWMSPQLAYHATKGIGPKTFRASGLNAKPFNHYECEDLVQGTINGIGFLLSDAVVGRLTTYSRNSRNGTRTSETYDEVFEGIFFVARYPDTMRSYVSRDEWEAELKKRSKDLKGKLQYRFKPPHLYVQVEDGDGLFRFGQGLSIEKAAAAYVEQLEFFLSIANIMARK